MKENDMDEMMRKAAANYNVDAERAADWNAVHNAVHATGATAEKKKRKRYFLFWWLLLVPTAWLAIAGFNKFISADIKNQKVNTTKVIDTGKSRLQALPGSSIIDNSSKINSGNQSLNNDNKTDDISNSYALYPSTTKRFKYLNSNQNNNYNSNAITENKFQPLINNNIQIQPSNNGFANTDNKNKTGEQISDNIANNQQSNMPVAKNNDTSTVQNNKIKNVKSATIKLHTSNNYFYAGLLAGTDISFIKNQRTQSPGYNAGILIGYKFNKISIESGLLYDKKNYYTKGNYFDKSKIEYFNDADLLTVNGYCRMYEIPLNVKYNFNAKKKHAWFAAAGFSSYLMNKEFYHYDYIKNGMQHQGSYPYYHTTKDWFSVLNLSAGYELKTGMKTNLRIEPYYKTSLSGVGTGSLSISSAGINVGVTRRIP